jgi:hypothetical protein
MLQCVKKDHIVYCIQINKKEDYRYLIDIPVNYKNVYTERIGVKWMVQTSVAFYPVEIAPSDWLIFEYDYKTGLPVKVIPNKEFHTEYLEYAGHKIGNKAVDPDSL